MKVSLDRLRENVKKRHKQIDETRKGIMNLLILNPKLQPIVDPDMKDEATKIMEKITALKKQNTDDAAFIAQVIATCRKNGVPCSDGEDAVNFDQMKADLKRQLEIQLTELKKKLTSGEVNGKEYDELKMRLSNPIETRIAELTAIDTELSTYRKNQGGENNAQA